MKWPTWRRRQDAQLDEEFHSHLDLAIQDRIDRGESPEQAAAAARQEFGNVLLIRETVRDMWGWTPIEQFLQDLGYARRALWRAPAFTIAAVLTLSPRHRRQHRHVQRRPRRRAPAAAVCRAGSAGGGARTGPAQRHATARLGVVAELLRLARAHANARVDGRAITRPVSPSPVSGRRCMCPAPSCPQTCFPRLVSNRRSVAGFATMKNAPGSDVVVISEEFRRNYLGASGQPGRHRAGRSTAAASRSSASCRRASVFPVTSPPPELWVTMAEDARVETPADTPMTAQRGAHFIQVVGRHARRRQRRSRAQAEFEEPGGRPGPGVSRRPCAAAAPRSCLQLDAIVGSAKRPLFLLLAAVVCVLLIACVNLANLMTARGVTRQPELALRVALGASRSRVVRLLLAEAVALAIASAICGVAIAWWSLDLLVGIGAARHPRPRVVSIDTVVFAYTALMAAVCAPAGRAGAGASRHARRSAPGHGRRAHLDRLAFAAPLAERPDRSRNGAWRGAAGRGDAGHHRLDRLARTNPGFDIAQVSTMRVNLPDSRYPYAKQVAFYDCLLPEIVAPSRASRAPPLSGRCRSRDRAIRLSFELAGDERAAGAANRPSAGFAFVSPGYFRAMRIPLRAGPRIHARRHRDRRREPSSSTKASRGSTFPARIRSASGSSPD